MQIPLRAGISLIILLLVPILISASSGQTQAASDHQGPINLNAGQKGSVYMPFYGGSGFAAPITPQPMVLDPGHLVHQGGIFRDEAIEARNEAYSLLNETRHLALLVVNNVSMAAESAEDSANNARAARAAAGNAEEMLEESRALFNETLAIRNETATIHSSTAILCSDAMDAYNRTNLLMLRSTNLSERLVLMEDKNASSGNQSSSWDGEEGRELSATQSTEGGAGSDSSISDLMRRLEDLERRVEALEKATGGQKRS